jgi:putative ABC transport system substrate-binding protein
MILGKARISRMIKKLILILIPLLAFSACREKPQPRRLYTIGYFQVVESDTANEARKGFIKALEDSRLEPGVSVDLEIRNALGDIPAVQKIAQKFVEQGVDMIVAHSTACLQAAMMATQKIPIIFIAVANPYLVNAGRSAEEHLSRITGVASTGPVRQTMALIKQVLPNVRRIGTLWTPSELNSEYYLNLARGAAAELGLEIVAVPVSSTNGVLLAAQILVSKKIDALFPISDNTINSSFSTLGRVAEENGIPLFGSFLLATRAGACAGLGVEFSEMGYQAGQMAARVRKGEDPARIPFVSLTDFKLHLNMLAAKRQGVKFPPEVLKRADEILTAEDIRSLTGSQAKSNDRP